MLRRFLLLSVLLSFGVQGLQQVNSGMVLRYCIDPDWMPYEAVRNDEHIGISKDYVQLISDATGIVFEFVPTQSWSDTLNAVRQNRCDAVPLINPSKKRRDFLSFSLPYFESPNVLVTRKGDDAVPGFSAVGDRTLGLVREYRHTEYIERYYQNINVYYVNSEKEGLALLSSGTIDVMVASLLSASVNINNNDLDNLILSGFAEPHDTLAVGLAKPFEYLIPVINEAIVAIPESKKMEVYKKWFRVEPVSRTNHSWIAFLALFIVFVIAIVVWIKRSQSRVQRELTIRDSQLESLQAALVEKSRTVEFLSTHDELTALHNRNFMVQKVDEEMSRFRRFHSPVTLLLINIDNLGRITRHIGQNKSDEIIKRLAQITLDKTREVDIAARWANEEVLILCPQTSTLSAQILAERILTEVELQSLQLFEGIKVSIGGASMQNDDSFVDWFDRTQQAMRNAKKQISHAYVSG